MTTVLTVSAVNKASLDSFTEGNLYPVKTKGKTKLMHLSQNKPPKKLLSTY